MVNFMHPAIRMFGAAALVWLGVVFYSFGIFHNFHASRGDHGQLPKELHPAGEFLRSAKARTFERGTKTLEELAEEACKQSMHADYVDDCNSDVETLNKMNPPVAYHYVRMLKNRKHKPSGNSNGDLLEGPDAEHPCMKINSQSHREKCYKLVLATNDLTVAKKMAGLISGVEDSDPVEITLHDASIACALAIEKPNCIHDVMGTGDLESAEIYDKMAAPKKNAESGEFELLAHHHKMTEEQAVQSCKMVHPNDREYCKNHVMKMDDEKTAEHYVHLLQDSEHTDNSGSVTISEAEGSSLCASVKSSGHEQQCLEDIWVLPNKHVADHFIKLYELPGKVSETEAEKLCNHLSRSHHNHETCIETLATMKDGPEAASHFSALLKSQQAEQSNTGVDDSKPRLTAEESQKVCRDVKDPHEQNACADDVQTLNDLVVAQQYAEMLAKKKS